MHTIVQLTPARFKRIGQGFVVLPQTADHWTLFQRSRIRRSSRTQDRQGPSSWPPGRVVIGGNSSIAPLQRQQRFEGLQRNIGGDCLAQVHKQMTVLHGLAGDGGQVQVLPRDALSWLPFRGLTVTVGAA